MLCIFGRIKISHISYCFVPGILIVRRKPRHNFVQLIFGKSHVRRRCARCNAARWCGRWTHATCCVMPIWWFHVNVFLAALLLWFDRNISVYRFFSKARCTALCTRTTCIQAIYGKRKPSFKSNIKKKMTTKICIPSSEIGTRWHNHVLAAHLMIARWASTGTIHFSIGWRSRATLTHWSTALILIDWQR